MSTKKLQLGLVEEMVSNYKNNQLSSILSSTAHPMSFDAQSVWLDLNTLKDFLKTIEEETALHPEYELKNFGVRFYYAAYPKKDKWDQQGYEDLAFMLTDPIAKDYEKLHTVIAIPTTEIDGINQDFDPFDTKTYDGTKPTNTTLAIMAENHGVLCPPPFSGSGVWF